MARRVVFVTGPGCGLCARAWSRLLPLRALRRIDVVDVTDEPRWLERIPVVTAPDGAVVWEQSEGGSPLWPATRYLVTGK